MDMKSSRDEDPKLTEVKAVLQRLQEMSAEPQTEASQHLAPLPGSRRSHTALTVAAALLAIVVVAGGLFVLTDPSRLLGSIAERAPQLPPEAASQAATPTKLAVAPGADLSLQPPAAPRATPARPALEAAIGLLSAGRIQAARRQLLAIASEDAADVAWALARSYDPNFLGTLRDADAEPDVAEATRWYRAWHVAAVKHGLVTRGVSLERIIGSMH
jgi:hypothetical protein